VVGAGASGVWTLEQQMQATAAGLWPVNGPFYIEDVFSTYLYTGTGATQTITNDIDLSTKGGLTWIKGRSGATGHRLTDTARGVTKSLESNSTAAEATEATGLTAFGTTGFTIGADADYNTSAATYVSWTFREQPKFFDIVTYTGNSTNRTIAHNLGSVPGTIIVRRTDIAANWPVYHRSLGATKYIILNQANASGTYSGYWNDTEPTSSVFSVGGVSGEVNATGGTYVAYLFAHDAGGFGLAGTDNVISCGSFTTDGSGNASVNLGYEPQFWLYKPTIAARYWTIYDVMRGWSQTQIANLNPNVADAEGGGAATLFYPTATGFDCVGGALDPNTQHIYIAIRRGPMKVPTLGTSVFSSSSDKPDATGDWGLTTLIDLMLIKYQTGTQQWYWKDRLRGANSTGTVNLNSASTSSESTYGNPVGFQRNVNFLDDYYGPNGYAGFGFKRAPSFFDEVCYTGTGSNTTFTHNLGAVPELIIVKRRDTTGAWDSYSSALANTEYVVVNTTAAKATGATRWNSTTPTSSVFSVGTSTTTNASAGTYVAYLFATCPGVSKVGSYTGTGAAQTINCGFTAGSRFVLIKRTDSTGDWYVWDSARGIIAGNDPYLLINSTAAEVTGTDYIDTAATGFEISSTAPAAINASGGTYIFLAIA
jgi:hypothetical protein